MSRMSDLNIEIQEYLMNGTPPEKVAETLKVPLNWVMDTLDYMMETDEPDMSYPEEL